MLTVGLTLLVLIACFGFVLLFGAPYLPTLTVHMEQALDLAELKPGELLLELGCGDGKVVVAANRGGDVVPGAEKVPVTLLQGSNTLLLKVTQWTSGWGFCARVAKPDGSPIQGVRVELNSAK